MSNHKNYGRIKYPPLLKERVNALRDKMDDWKVDAVLVSNDRDIRYLTNFIGDEVDEGSAVLVRANSAKPTIISDFRYTEEIERNAPHCTVVMRKGPMADVIEKLVKRYKLDKVGVQSSHMRLSARKSIAKKIGARAIKDLDDQLVNHRAVKAPVEVRAIRKAIKIQQDAYRKTVRWLKPGMTEQQVSSYLLYQMRQLGADKESFDPIVAVDANAALPHAVPGRKKVRAGGILLIDWGAKVDGYCSDMTRTVAIGKWPRKMRKIYEIVLEAQLAAIDAIGPGVALKDVDAAARKVIKKAGYAKQFGHGLGHGIGLDIHEQPRLGEKAKGELEVGHVVTVEPGIYLPGVGGVRIEDDVLVTARGHEVLCDLPKGVDDMII